MMREYQQYVRSGAMCWCVCLCVFCLCFAVDCQDIVVSFRDGSVAGAPLTTVKGRDIYGFYNIPYAKPPIGQLRFREPQNVARWEGVRPGFTPGPACLQHITQSFQTVGEEDCLYLNVFTPILPNVTSIPPWFAVIVFFHNGVFITGDSKMYQPGYLLDDDIILVTVNFRLGVLGFLSTEDGVVPGNNGLKDQVQALRWVRDNVGAFGGDGTRVTIAGNSAGAVSVHLHTLSPLSASLFKQAIVQSGSALVPWTITRKPREKTEFIASTLGCPKNDSNAMVDCLRSFSPKQLIVFTQSYEVFINTPFAPFGPSIEKSGENAFLTEDPLTLLLGGCALDVPIIFSDCENEGLYPLAGIIDNERRLDFLDRRWTEVAPYLLNFNDSVSETLKPYLSQSIREYYVNGPISAESDLSVVQMFGDRQFLSENGKATSLHAKTNFFNPVYFYLFTYRGKNSYSEFYNPTSFENYGAANGDDSLYIFENTGEFFNASFIPEDLKMRDLMVKMWTSFAITGVPQVENVRWTPVSRSDFDTRSLTYLKISSPSDLSVVNDNNFGNISFWSSLPFQQPGNVDYPYT